MPPFDVSVNISPTVVDGKVNWHFDKFEKVTHAIVQHDASNNTTGDVSGSIDISVNVGTDASANNHVNCFVYIKSSPAVGTAQRRAAVTADLTGKKFTVVAFGE